MDAFVSYIQKYLTPKRILGFGAGSGEMTQELQHCGYQFTLLEPMNDGYLKDQQYLYLFNVIAVKVIDHFPSVWAELEQTGKVLEPEGLMVFSTDLANPLIEFPDAAKHFKTWWYKNVDTPDIFLQRYPRRYG